MSGNDLDVVALAEKLESADSLDDALRSLAVSDDGKPDADDEFDANDAGKGGDGNDEAAGTGGDNGEAAKNGQRPADDVAAAPGADAGKSTAAASGDGQGSQPDAGVATGEQPAPIQNKNGTATIPYTVLTSARQRAAQVEAELAETKRDRDAAREALAKAQAAAAPDTSAQSNVDAMDLTDEELDDMPEPVKKLAKYAKALEEKVAKIESTAGQVASQHQHQQQESLQDEIDAVPDLAEWQGKGGILWARSIEIDKAFRNQPEWANKPLRERFEAVAEAVRAEVGLPPRQQQQTQGKTEQAGQHGAKPTDQPPSSLSDIPGGGAPMLDTHDSIERTSAVGLASRMTGMSDANIDALLASLS